MPATDKLEELYERKRKLVAEVREIGERLRGDESTWSAEDRQEWESRNEELDEVIEEIEQLETRDAIDTRLSELAEDDQRRQHARRSEHGQHRSNRLRTNITDEQRALAFNGLILRNIGQDDGITSRHQEALAVMGLGRARHLVINLGTGHIRSWYAWTCQRGRRPDLSLVDERAITEFRAPLDTGTASGGAEWTPSDSFRAELIRTLVRFGGIRQAARIIATSSGEPMTMPTADDTGNQAEAEVAENTALTPADPTTGDLTWGAYKYGSLIKWSYELMQDSPLGIQTLLAEMLGERIGRRTASRYAIGTGTGQPQGFTVGASDSTFTWDISPANPYDNADALLDVQGALDPAYESSPSVGWAFHKKTLTAIRKLKDSNGQYLWVPGLRPGETDLLAGAPYVIDQSMDYVPTASKRVVVYGDFARYIIRDVGAMRTKILSELYAANDQIGMTVWLRTDAKVALAAALKYMATTAT